MVRCIRNIDTSSCTIHVVTRHADKTRGVWVDIGHHTAIVVGLIAGNNAFSITEEGPETTSNANGFFDKYSVHAVDIFFADDCFGGKTVFTVGGKDHIMKTDKTSLAVKVNATELDRSCDRLAKSVCVKVEIRFALKTSKWFWGFEVRGCAI